MKSLKYLFFAFFFGISFLALSQDTSPVLMKWKLKPGEVLTYKTVMQEIDTANQKDFSMDGMMKLLGNALNDTAARTLHTNARKIFKELGKLTANANLITKLSEDNPNEIDIEMFMDNNSKNAMLDSTSKDTTFRAFRAMEARASSGVMLRGTIDELGGITSFYTANAQKNLIALLFELPGRLVRVGDSWPLTINLIQMDQNFKCDTSFKRNKVAVTGIKYENKQHIVTLSYDIAEYVGGDFYSPFNNSVIKSSMKMTFKAIADFSVEKGRWVDYNGIMTLVSTGAMTSQSVKQVSLIQE